MTCVRATPFSVPLSLQGDTRNISNLYSAMEKRVLAMRRASERTSDEGSQSEDDSECQQAPQRSATPANEETEHTVPAEVTSSQPPGSVAGEGGEEVSRSTKQAEDSEVASKGDEQPG